MPAMMTPRILLATNFYPEFLSNLYAASPDLAGADYDTQLAAIYATGFASSDVYLHGMATCGCEATQVIVNADTAQARWAKDHGLTPSGNIHDQRRQIVAAQVKAHEPDVLYVFEWCPLGDSFLADMKTHVRLVAGQISSPLRNDRTYASYDVMFSSWPPIVTWFRQHGQNAEPLRLAFDDRILDRVEPRGDRYDATFVGGFAPTHGHRISWLERIVDDIDLDIFGYGLDQVDPDSPIRGRHHGQVWGIDMYNVLRQSKLTLNIHAYIDVGGVIDTTVAANMRLYEATGMGTCLVTERMSNLADMFEPDREVVTYADQSECVERMQYYLHHDAEREAIAQAGLRRTLREHTYPTRMAELLDLLARYIK